jgi:transcription-repair coupling factor (superfamily II helicase)
MIIDTLAREIAAVPALKPLFEELNAGRDATLAVAPTCRSLVVAALYARNPKAYLYIVPTEDAARATAAQLTAWLGPAAVTRYPQMPAAPWHEVKPKEAIALMQVVGARTAAVAQLAAGEPGVVVASATALLRRVPPAGVAYYQSVGVAVGDTMEPSQLVEALLAKGYLNAGEAAAPGELFWHGDTVDVFGAQAAHPVRVEFFGDEVDRIRTMVAATGQTIASQETACFAPAREYALTPQTIAHARTALYNRAQNSAEVAADLESIEAGIPTGRTARYLPELYGALGQVTDHMAPGVTVILNEPRSLFDACMHRLEDLARDAAGQGCTLDELYIPARQLDFGSQQRLNLSTLVVAGGLVTAELVTKPLNIAGSVSRLLGTIRAQQAQGNHVLICEPRKDARDGFEQILLDEHLAFIELKAGEGGSAGAAAPVQERREEGGVAEKRGEALGAAAAGAAPGATAAACAHTHAAAAHKTPASPLIPLPEDAVAVCDVALETGVVIPPAHLALIGRQDLEGKGARKARRRAKAVDITAITFAFAPGDYVVHESHGVAKFAQIVRKEVDGRERDYFLLEYAGGDKLYVPLEQVGRLTKYVGPDGDNPRLTRLNTADWARASAKARKNVKKLAFDLVDLYTRRATAVGFAHGPDTLAQREMEEAFPYELTADQQRAVDDIKGDMESSRPMDRLLCGDVGFGKTEVALRAAFKCAQSGRQVMVLCPTTILAQQHYETFYERFSPYGVTVDVLSRFRTPAEQRRALEAFAAGTLKVLIGTHRLLSRDVNPQNLGLVIVDEEQRFGVAHKEQLKNLREQVDVLTLSATPIPRTMQMSLSGVRDMSLILTAPTGRKPVRVVVGEYNLDTVSEAVRRELARNGQVYYVSNRVSDIEEAVARVLEAAPEARVGVAHGQMSAKEVEDVMVRFAEHAIDVLVATTIIESGIDNPHTNTLIIEDSQRLGLAQLYQLKGRVGRGREQAWAYFMFPAGEPLTPEATERLMAIYEYQDLGSGMRIAMRDLEIRGAGNLVGGEQHGNLSSVGFDLYTKMLAEAVAEAREAADAAAGYGGDGAGAGGAGGAAGADKSAGTAAEKSGEPAEPTINLGADYYLDEEYVPRIDRRVLYYRRIATATELAQVDDIERDLLEECGELNAPAENLLTRARVRIRAERLGVRLVALVSGRLMLEGAHPSAEQTRELKAEGALVYPKSGKVAVPLAGRSALPLALDTLSLLGGADEE